MRILILETSFEKGAVILTESGFVLRSKILSSGPNLSKNLSLVAKNILSNPEPFRPQIIAVSHGPGSYTGIRVGLALGKAFAMGWDVPLIGYCSLKGFGTIPLLIDARLGGFYALFGDKAEKIAPEDPRIQNFSSLSSPHPELIQKRLCRPAPLKYVDLDPAHLAKSVWEQFKTEGIQPIELNYL